MLSRWEMMAYSKSRLPTHVLLQSSILSMAALQVPLVFSLQDWDEGTLGDKGQYTPESDVCQIGVMLLKSQCLSAANMAFADKLMSKSISAADAAQDSYFL